MANAEWDAIKDTVINTEELMEQHLSGYETLLDMVPKEYLLSYLDMNGVTVGTQYQNDIRSYHVPGTYCTGRLWNDKWIDDCDEYGRPKYDKYTGEKLQKRIPQYFFMVRDDKMPFTQREVANTLKNLLLYYSNSELLSSFINDTDMHKLYLQKRTGREDFKDPYYGEVSWTEYKKYECFKDLCLVKEDFAVRDKKGNIKYNKKGEITVHRYITYNADTNICCNNIKFYVSLEKLAKYVLDNTNKMV